MNKYHRNEYLAIVPPTHRNNFKGKNIRKKADGSDIFEDSWTDSDHDNTESAITNLKSDCMRNNSSSMIIIRRKYPVKNQALGYKNLQPGVNPCFKIFSNKTVALNSLNTSEQSEPTTSISKVDEDVSVESAAHFLFPRTGKSPVKNQELGYKNLQPEVNTCTKSFRTKYVVLNSAITDEQREPTISILNVVEDVSVEAAAHFLSPRTGKGPVKNQELSYKNLQPEVNTGTKSFRNKSVVLNSPITGENREPNISILNVVEDVSVESTGHLVGENDNVNSLPKNKYVSTVLGQDKMLKIDESILELRNKRRNMKNSAVMETILSRYDGFDVATMQRIIEKENTGGNDTSQHTHIETVPVKNKTENVDKSMRSHKMSSRSLIFKENILSPVSLHKRNSQVENKVSSLSKKNLCNSSDQVSKKVKYIHKKYTENTDKNYENPVENNRDIYEDYIDESKKILKKIPPKKKNKNDLKRKSNQHRVTSPQKHVKKGKKSLSSQKLSETVSKNSSKRVMDHEGDKAATSEIEHEESANVSNTSLHYDSDIYLHQSLNSETNPVATCSSPIASEQMLKKNWRGKKKNSDIQIRRSSRQRYSRLARWRNQRLLYRFQNGDTKIIGVDEGMKEDDNALKQLQRAQMRCLEKESQKLKDHIPKKIQKLGVVVGNKTLPLEVLKEFNSIPWENDYKGSFVIKRAHETENVSFGFLQIKINGIKPTQYMPDQDVHLTVLKGKVEINTRDLIFELEERDTFMIPRKTPYCLKNLGNIKALIQFVVGKFHFIESQDL